MSDETTKPAPEGGAEERPEPLSPPTFTDLVRGLALNAFILMSPPPADEKEAAEAGPPDPSGARHYIDLLAMLSEKTKGNLTLEEHRFLENSLTELRFRYVQAVEESRKK